MKKEKNVVTPEEMKLSRTTFAFNRELNANTQPLHKANTDSRVNSSKSLISARIEYGKDYAEMLDKVTGLVARCTEGKKVKDVQSIVADNSKEFVHATQRTDAQTVNI